MAVSSERLISIAFSYQYFTWVTDASVKKLIIVLWTVILAIASLPLLGWNMWQPGGKCMTMQVYHFQYFLYFFALPILISLSLTALCNITICLIAIQKRRVAPQQIIVSNNVTNGDNSNGTTNHSSTASKQFKITKMMLMVVGVFYISWLPYLMLTILYFTPPQSWMKHGVPEWVLAVHEVSKGLLLFNAAINPVIYAWKNSKFRNAFSKLLGHKPQFEAGTTPIQSVSLNPGK